MTDIVHACVAVTAILTASIATPAAAGNPISSAPFDLCDAQATRKCGRFSELSRNFWKCYDPDFDACMETFRPRAAAPAGTSGSQL